MQNRNNFLNRNPNTLSYKRRELPVNVKRNDNVYEMEVAMPGFKKSELSVTMNGGILSIKGEKKKMDFPAKKYILQEFECRTVERKFKISEEISKEKIEAHYKNGMLKLKFIDVPEIEEKYVKNIKVA